MGSDGLMQALIRGWDMFSVQFNLVVLNHINMCTHSCTRVTQTSCDIHGQSQSGRSRQRMEMSLRMALVFTLGLTESLVPSWRSAWWEICCLWGHELKTVGRWDRFYVQS